MNKDSQAIGGAGELLAVEQCDVDRLAYSVANAKLGEGPSVRCEGPTEFEVRIAREWVGRVLAALATRTPTSAAPEETCELCGGACLKDSDKPLPAWVKVYDYPSAAPEAGEDALREALEVRRIETVPLEHPFTDEETPPFWRLEIDGYCADFDHKQAARNFADAIAALASRTQSRARMEGEEAALLDMLQRESWDLRCFEVPTGGGDADVGWRVIGHWQARPHERVIAEVFHDDPREALRRARAATKTEGDVA